VVSVRSGGDEEPSDVDDGDEDELSAEEQQEIERARTIAYAKRAARAQQAASLNFQPISAGNIFSARSFLPADLVEALRADAFLLEEIGEFKPSGLSKAAQSSQGFGNADRLVRALTPDLDGNRDARRDFQRHLDALREAVGSALGRTLVCAESYYSIHRSAAFLPRHMDEKHEELKGARGWATNQRRSVSWLLYLSGEHEGGAFRGYVHTNLAGSASVGAHAGNLQVGWLAAAEGEAAVRAGDDARDDAGAGRSQCSATAAEPAYMPVYMDSWVRAPSRPPGALSRPPEAPPDAQRPLSALYTVGRSGTRDWLSESFDTASEGSCAPGGTPDSDGTPTPDGTPDSRRVVSASSLAERLPPQLRHRFSSVEAVPHEGGPPAAVIDVSAVGGTLVMFDAVCVPHEVLPTTSGARVAMAGWFHEPQRDFPEWFEARAAPLRRRLRDLPAVARHGG